MGLEPTKLKAKAYETFPIDRLWHRGINKTNARIRFLHRQVISDFRCFGHYHKGVPLCVMLPFVFSSGEGTRTLVIQLMRLSRNHLLSTPQYHFVELLGLEPRLHFASPLCRSGMLSQLHYSSFFNSFIFSLR